MEPTTHQSKEKQKLMLAPHGCVTAIHRITGYSRTTIRRALRQNSKGEKAEKVREIFRKKYLETMNNEQ